MEAAVGYQGPLLATPVVSAAAPVVQAASWTNAYRFGYPFLSDTNNVINTNAPSMTELKGTTKNF
jgi:hypothetical protein